MTCFSKGLACNTPHLCQKRGCQLDGLQGSSALQRKHFYNIKEEGRMINEQLEMFQPDPLQEQVQGSHYKQFVIQPAEYIFKNSLGFLEGNAIKYITRYPLKNGIVDIDKAIHCLQMLKSLLQQKETK